MAQCILIVAIEKFPHKKIKLNKQQQQQRQDNLLWVSNKTSYCATSHLNAEKKVTSL